MSGCADLLGDHHRIDAFEVLQTGKSRRSLAAHEHTVNFSISDKEELRCLQKFRLRGLALLVSCSNLRLDKGGERDVGCEPESDEALPRLRSPSFQNRGQYQARA